MIFNHQREAIHRGVKGGGSPPCKIVIPYRASRDPGILQSCYHESYYHWGVIQVFLSAPNRNVAGKKEKVLNTVFTEHFISSFYLVLMAE